MKPRLFIASSSERLNIAYAVQENLQLDAEPTVWDQGVFQPSQSAIEGLLGAVEQTDFAICVFAPDDLVAIRDSQYTSPRDNVIFECGLFIGRLGRERTFFLLPQGHETLRLPSDLLGITAGTYDATRSDFRASLGPACNQFRILIRRLGPRDTKKAAVVHTQKDVYAYVLNRLHPYSDLSLTQDFLRNLPNRNFIRIDDVLYPLDSLIHHYVPQLIDEHLRVYFAYQLLDTLTVAPGRHPSHGEPFHAHYRIGISCSLRTDKWYEGLPVGIPSNIHRTYIRKGISKVRNARDAINTQGVQNEKVEDEGSVIAVPLLFGDDDGQQECIGVVGISSPLEDEATKPEVEALVHELGLLFSALFYAYGRYLQRGRTFEEVIRMLRAQIADHFESKFNFTD